MSIIILDRERRYKTMTVKELINELLTMDMNDEIIIADYTDECDFNLYEIVMVQSNSIQLKKK